MMLPLLWGAAIFMSCWILIEDFVLWWWPNRKETT